jgi:divalent metal cation (Fe/Co/Zn/Cd) transporter
LELNTLVGQIKNHPYGWSCRTFNYVYSGWFSNTSATIIAYDILNIRIAHDSPKPWTLLVVGANYLERVFFSVSDEKKCKTNSSSLKADAWHHRSDAITSVAALEFLWLYC